MPTRDTAIEMLDPAMDGASPNIAEQNLEVLRELFPDAFTESSDDDGPRWRVDFDALRGIVGNDSEDAGDRYNFTWHGKAQARRIAQTPSTGTLRPCPDESVDWETTQNLFIEGDNLEVLKLLQKAYHKSVKMIYIDPPYNTGNEFIYPDRYQDNLSTYFRYTGQIDAQGLKFSANAETSGRYHTNWLNMMYPRLKLARNLLAEDGVILMSIDDHEVSRLRLVCDELFGEENFIAQIVWKSRKFTDARSVRNVSNDHEYILAYGKSETVAFRGRARDESKYQNPDDDPRGPWMSRSILGLATKDQRPNLHYDILDPATGTAYSPPGNTGWRYARERMEELVESGAILFPSKPGGRPREKKFRADLQSEYTSFPSIVDDVHTSDGTQFLRELFGAQVFDFPKPHQLLERLVEQCLPEGGIVLDFFAGACATAHAAMNLRQSSGLDIRYIMVQLPEPCAEGSEAAQRGFASIAEIGKERIRLCGRQSKNTQATGESKGGRATTTTPDFGVKVFTLDSSNIQPWDADFDTLDESLFKSVESIKPDRAESDVLYELLLKFGLDLAVPIDEREIAGSNVFIIGAGALVVSLADNITLDIVNGIAALKDELQPEVMRVVLKDDGFKDDVVKTNAIQILRQRGIEDVKSL